MTARVTVSREPGPLPSRHVARAGRETPVPCRPLHSFRRLVERLLGAALHTLSACAPAPASIQNTPSMLDTAAPTDAAPDLYALNDALTDRWDQADAQGYGDLFTDDVDYIPVTGVRYEGRDALVRSHQALFEGPLRGTTLQGRLLDVRLLAPDIALVHRVGSLRFPGVPDGVKPAETIQTMVVVERDGRWQITAFQNTDVRETPHGGGEPR